MLITNPRDIPAFVQELRKWRMTMITGVNTLYSALLNHPGFRGSIFRGSSSALRGMALHPSTAEKWLAVTRRPLAKVWLYGSLACRSR